MNGLLQIEQQASPFGKSSSFSVTVRSGRGVRPWPLEPFCCPRFRDDFGSTNCLSLRGVPFSLLVPYNRWRRSRISPWACSSSFFRAFSRSTDRACWAFQKARSALNWMCSCFVNHTCCMANGGRVSLKTSGRGDGGDRACNGKFSTNHFIQVFMPCVPYFFFGWVWLSRMFT